VVSSSSEDHSVAAVPMMSMVAATVVRFVLVAVWGDWRTAPLVYRMT